jgi:large subunit ribosomal protein L6
MVGVGYRANMQGKTLVVSAGYSHPVNFEVPETVEVSVEDNTTIVVKGSDKQLVGQVASNIKKIRKPEPYKGKGIKYTNEVIRRKPGKSGKGEGA